VGLGGRREAEHREERPDAVPAVGEDAGPGGGTVVSLRRMRTRTSSWSARGGEPMALSGALAAAAQQISSIESENGMGFGDLEHYKRLAKSFLKLNLAIVEEKKCFQQTL